jgi:hypothetical protein
MGISTMSTLYAEIECMGAGESLDFSGTRLVIEEVAWAPPQRELARTEITTYAVWHCIAQTMRDFRGESAGLQ